MTIKNIRCDRAKEMIMETTNIGIIEAMSAPQKINFLIDGESKECTITFDENLIPKVTMELYSYQLREGMWIESDGEELYIPKVDHYSEGFVTVYFKPIDSHIYTSRFERLAIHTVVVKAAIA